MSSRSEYRDFLHDMFEYSEKAMRFVQGVSFDEFAASDITTLAVVRALEIVGEAARHVPQPVRTKYPNVPWKQIIGMRDRITHGYFVVDLEVVWKTVHEDLPPLCKAIQRILDDLEQ